ncbi:MAG: hypothetical protein GAK45_02169 [Pseudomonas citronellolis]|nr:MAG: hypothetical protein GAK45_02169 [Pseudomonas citronellolis]
MIAALIAFLHFVSIFLMFALLVLEHRLFKPSLDVASARSLTFIDLAYGASAAVVLLTGIARVLWFAKGPQYYLHNAAFHGLVGLFVLVALISAYPTLTYLNWRNRLRAGQPPEISTTQARWVVLIIRVELLGLILAALLASLMAHGIGLFGG